MAGIEKEIEALKSLCSNCKVIKHVGDFDFVITANIKGTELSVKFQLTADYPTTPAVVFIRGIPKDLQNRILYDLRDSKFSLSEYFSAISECVEMEGFTCSGSTGTNSSPRSSKKAGKKTCNPQKVDNSSTHVSSKKPPMRTAADVVKRVQWDSALDKEKFVVGYLDRFIGIQEQPFTAFNWVNPAEADWMDLNIPEHRIEYFKYDGTIVWEKQSRTDNIFGSTGGSTIDVMLVTNSEDENVNQTGDAEESTNPPEPTEQKAEHTDESSDEDDNVCISLRPTIVNPLKEVKRLHKPNHFIALPITVESVQGLIAETQTGCSTHAGKDLSEYMVKEANLHVTLCALRIDDDNDLDNVSQCIYEQVAEFGERLNSPLNIAGLDNFWNRVLYAKVCAENVLAEFVLSLRKKLLKLGVRTFDDDIFIPHVTILKFYQSSMEKFSVEDFIKCQSGKCFEFGQQPIEQVQLLSMERDDNGHYKKAFYIDV